MQEKYKNRTVARTLETAFALQIQLRLQERRKQQDSLERLFIVALVLQRMQYLKVQLGRVDKGDSQTA